MKFFISIDKKEEFEKLKQKINRLDKKATIYTGNINEEKSKLNDSDIIVCDNNQDKISSLKDSNKCFFVYMSKEDQEQEDFSKTNTLINLIIKEEPKKKIKKKKIITITATIILIIFVIIIAISTNTYQKTYSDRKIQKITQTEQKNSKKDNEDLIEKAKIDNMKKENYIFLGDSITEIYHLDEYYSNIPHINSGVSAYTTDDILKHMEDFVYVYNPTKVILLIGTNDVEVEKYNNKELVNQIKKIVNLIQKHRPKAEIYVESIYPVNNNPEEENVNLKMVGIRENERIIEINKLIKKMCTEEKVKYINMYDELTDEDGNFNMEYTYDGLHPSEKGYDVITKKLKNVLNLE